EATTRALVQLRFTQPVTFTVGDTVAFGNLKLRPPQGTFAAYAMKEGLAATGTITKKTTLQVIERAGPLRSLRTRVRNSLVAGIQQKMSPQSYALFATIFLGQKQKQQHHVQHAFAHWGLSHQLARSGLHLVIFILILRW